MDVAEYVSTHRPVNGGYRSNTEDDVVLKTNKQIYSQLLRATANKNAALLERIDVLVHLLDQLARGGGGGVQ